MMHAARSALALVLALTVCASLGVARVSGEDRGGGELYQGPPEMELWDMLYEALDAQAAMLGGCAITWVEITECWHDGWTMTHIVPASEFRQHQATSYRLGLPIIECEQSDVWMQCHSYQMHCDGRTVSYSWTGRVVYECPDWVHGTRGLFNLPPCDEAPTYTWACIDRDEPGDLCECAADLPG